MAKRFSDSEKWKKPFLRAMKAPYKLLWLYILDECDHAGIWQVDFEVAQVKIGEKLNYEKALEQLNGKIHVFDNNEKWFIPDFIDFQYGSLNEKNRVHESVINLLSKYDLIEILQKNKPLTSSLNGAKDKDMDKEEEMEKEKVEEKEKKPREEKAKSLHVQMREIFCDEYKRATGITYAYGAIDGKKINEIESQIRVTIRDKIDGYNDEDVLNTFKILIINLPQWYRKNAFDLKTIAGSYSKIIGQLNIKHNGTNFADLDRQTSEVFSEGNRYT